MTSSEQASTLQESGSSPARAMLAATSTSVVAVTPAFLLGATAVLVRPDLGFGQAGLGVAVTAFFIASSLIAVLAGRAVERLGATMGLRLICFGSGASVMAIAVFADSLFGLTALMSVAGVVNGFSQPAANLTLAREVRRRQGLMFGVKQSAIPFSTLLAGASVPVVALQLGWRWTFGAAGFLSWLAIVAVPDGLARASGSPSTGHHSVPGSATSWLVWLSVAAGSGTAGATAMAAFLVESASVSGMSLSAAGWLLVMGSLTCVSARVVAGAVVDWGLHSALSLVSIMLGFGAWGYILLAVGQPWMMLVGALLSYTLGWGWTGLLMYAVVRLNPGAPAEASGIVLTGAAAGAAFGPVGFGLIVTHASFQLAWLACAISALASALLIELSRRQLMGQLAGDDSQ